MRLNLILFLAFTWIARLAVAQDDKEKNIKDFFQIKAPAIEYTRPDMQEIMFEDKLEGEEDEAVYFNPERELSIVSEDTTEGEGEEGELSIVEVSEEINMDSVWVTIAQYYAIWDSRTVNPYKVDPSTYTDTISFRLYDSTSNFLWSMPLSSCPVNSEFGFRHSRWHYGTDLDLSVGDPVYAAFDGIVRINKYDGRGYGNYIMLRHYNGLETLYGHLSESYVTVGTLVKAGDKIGLGGNTGRSSGPHLHYEVRYEGNAINPEEVYDFTANTLRGQEFKLTPDHFRYMKQARQIVYHRVKSGETIGSISRKYRVSQSTIFKLNKMSSRSTLRVGQKIRIR
jgi:murein DD-endopeptidase MepM/ murein hydrolase activator NlpD